MASEAEVQQALEMFKSFTREQLINQMHSYVPHSARHIAAKIHLDKMDQIENEGRAQEARKQHLEVVAISQKANWLSTVALVVAVLSLLVALAAWLKG